MFAGEILSLQSAIGSDDQAAGVTQGGETNGCREKS
jgi:hypothetical protein